MVSGNYVAIDVLAHGLQSGDKRLTAEVVRQIARDRAERLPRSETLVAICGVFKQRTLAFLRRVYLPHDEALSRRFGTTRWCACTRE
jgi:hypothetical protein